MGQRLVRVISVLRALESGDPVTVDALADDFGVSRRTVFRDLEALRDAGLRVDYSHRQDSHRLQAHSRSEPRSSDLAQLLLMAAVTQLPHSAQQLQQAQRAASVLIKWLPMPLQKRCSAMYSVASSMVAPTKDAAVSGSIDATLDAIGNGLCVRVTERFPADGASTRTWIIRPCQLFIDPMGWKLEGVVLPTGENLVAALEKVGVEHVDQQPSLASPPGGHTAVGKIMIV